MLRGIDLEDAFLRVNTVLSRHAKLWTPQPFMHKTLPWEEDFPAMSCFLRALSEEQGRAMEGDVYAIASAVAPFFPEAQEIVDLALLVGPMAQGIEPDLGPFFEVDIPGRKLAQIEAFSRTLPDQGLDFLDWCGGKGHLGRMLGAWHRRRVTCLERQETLCADGRALGLRDQVEMAFHCVDVLADQSAELLQPSHHVVALHACGPLHRRLLEQARPRQIRAIHLSPCCYVLDVVDHYKPLSTFVQDRGMPLTRNQVRLALQETVFQAQRLVHRRQRFNRWRLGFDCLQRDLRGIDAYRPMPTVSQALLDQGFTAFCHHMAGLIGLALPPDLDLSRYEEIGALRQKEVLVLELPRLLFRRALEIWLVLDRGLFLHEQGYDVTVGLFCSHTLTPRNLLIQALR